MGRYYQTDNGRGGKFMFGVQSSTDPQYMGMTEQEQCSIDYYADKDNEPKIKRMLDKQYDILGVPEDKRIYYTDAEWKDYDKFEKQYLRHKVFVSVKEDDETEMAKHKGETRWSDDKQGYVSFEIKGMPVVLARIRLGLTILSDIKDTGECWLNAEL